MLRLLLRFLRWPLFWHAALVVTVAALAFWTASAAVAAIIVAIVGPEVIESDPNRLVRVTFPVSSAAAVAAIAALTAVAVTRRRGRVREWAPLRDAMLRDATTVASTHLAQVLTTPSPAAGGHMLARDLITGHQGPLWLPGWNLPPGAVVCFTTTPGGAQVRAWMTGKLWRATSREADRIERHTARALAHAERKQHRRPNGAFVRPPGRQSPKPNASCTSTTATEPDTARGAKTHEPTHRAYRHHAIRQAHRVAAQFPSRTPNSNPWALVRFGMICSRCL